MIVEMIRRGLARRTQESYLWGVISLANHYHRSPDRISECDIEDFLLSMSRRHLAPASVRLAWNGIAFFYGPISTVIAAPSALIRAKVQKDRYTVLAQRAIVVLDQYRSGVESEPWIFPGAKPGRYLSQSCVQRAYNEAKAAAGITKRGSIHALRHAFATHLGSKS